MCVLSFEGVHKSYTPFESAVKGVSFCVELGEFVAVAGPSGSGKTTILNLAAGLDSPTKGVVTLLERNLTQLDRKAIFMLRRANVGFVFQSYNLFPVLTALENVEYPLAINRVSKKERRVLATAALEEVGLGKLLRRFPAELSGGQQQRVAIARALVNQPQIIFADEPTANLDSQTGAGLLSLFRELNSQKGITFFFASHDPAVLRCAHRILEVIDGQVRKDSRR